MILGIDHLNIVVADMARSLAFYCGVLGFTKTKEAHLEGEWIEKIVGLPGVRAHAVFIEAPGGGPRIELLHYHAPEGVALSENSRANTRGLRHFALRVDDIAAVLKLHLELTLLVAPRVFGLDRLDVSRLLDANAKQLGEHIARNRCG